MLVIACYSFPYVFVFTRSALDLVSSEMEDAANTLGAGVAPRARSKSRCRWSCPPSSAAFIVEFLEAIALFGVPALIALPARFQVITTTLWQFFEFPPKLEVAAAYSMPLLAITVLLFWLAAARHRAQGYVALTGKGGERRMVRAGRWRWAVLGYCLFVTSLSFFLPHARGAPGRLRQGLGAGLLARQPHPRQHPLRAVDQQATPTATVHTFVYGGGGLGHRARRWRSPSPTSSAAAWSRSRSALALVAMAPFVIPGIVLAIGFYAAYTARPLRALRNRVDPHPGLRHALPAHRLHQQRRGHPQPSTPSWRTPCGSWAAAASWPCAGW